MYADESPSLLVTCCRDSRSPRISVGEFETPDYMRPSMEFEVPEEPSRRPTEEAEAEAAAARLFEKGAVSRLTHMFRQELARQLDTLESAGEEAQVELDEFLQKIMGTKKLTRRDRGISFYQLLVLQSLAIVETEQTEPFGSILVSKGTRYAERFSQI